MPSISKIRFTHVMYEGGNKRYNDETFLFDGHNGAIVLENGGGKTVFIQTALQAMSPHTDLAGRKIKDTLLLENGPAHIAVEWILNDKPRRRYAVACISLFLSAIGVDSYRYVYEYSEHDDHGLDHIPFVKEHMGKTRPSDKGEIQDYYSSMAQRYPLTARTFGTIKEYRSYLEEHYHIIASEWEAIAKINSTEGGIENFFDECKSTSQLFDRLLIPTVEEAMEGFQPGGFAALFESHREEFKRYKELKEQIAENKLILQELSRYVLVYEGLHEAQQRYDEARGEAKAYRELSLRQHEETKAEQTGLAARLQEWMQRSEALQLELKSLEIAEAEQEQSALSKCMRQLQEEADRQLQRLKQGERSFYSLKYAEQRVSRETAGARLQQLELQLARLEQSEDEQRLQQRWETCGGKLRAVFARDEREVSAKLDAYRSELGSLKQEQAETEKAVLKLRQEIRTWELQLREKETQAQAKKEQQEQIARAVLANPSLEKVEEQMPIWSEQQQQLEERRIDHMRALKEINAEQNAVRSRQKTIEEDIRRTEREQAKLEQQREQLQEQHNVLACDLAALRPNWQRLTSLYDKAASISEQLLEGIQKRQDQKSDCLHKERLAYRYVDDYHEQDMFFADPVIEGFVHSWSRQFSLLQTGIQYIRSLNLDEEGRSRAKDALWPVTLVTTGAEKKLLMQKLAAAGEEFAFPVRVLGAGEAAEIVRGSEGGVTEEQWAVPDHWRSNEDEAVFRQWKAGLLHRAGQIRKDREEKEEELVLWQRMEQRFRQFLNQYPLAAVQTLEQQLQVARKELISCKQQHERHEQRLNQLEEAVDKYRTELAEMQDLIHQLGVWLKDGQRYQALGFEREKLEKELVPVKQQLAGLERQLQMNQYRLQRLQEEQTAVERSCNDTNIRLQVLRSDELYGKVQPFAHVNSSRPLAELKEEYRVLERERAGIMKERNQLETEQEYEREKITFADKAMHELLREHPDLNERMILLVEAETQKEALWQQIEGDRAELERVSDRLQVQQAKLQKSEGRLENLRVQFSGQFPKKHPVSFGEALEQVRQRLRQENVRLQQEKKEWQQRSDAVELRLGELEQVLRLWDKHALVHRLDDSRLRTAALDECRLMDFAYARMDFSERSVAGLQSCQEKMEEERIQVARGRDSFKNYCVSRVQDVKLRQMAIQGIELKDSYAEVMEFRQTMETRIQKAIHIAEETIQTHDRDLQEFIQRVHMHLKQIMQELKELPRKTRIKTADGWREIYSFMIPEWEDQDGKDRIRSHVEWILEQLERIERERPSDEQSKLPQGEVRRRLEKWLDSRQLLQVVLKNEAMKVSCRKVMNDHQVTKASYSWEQSNRWSGGEKWSKNMTLFLGLLNYVAERRQYIETNMKIHRTVILDNPFGKASSDHVLSPVFFIAEQLGFQIIALTAHAEGKFLHDYFPIVYSCRLRSTSDVAKQIIEPTKRVQSAYFRDHAPETLERIDSRMDQVKLF
ncbi:chromosome segregation ATPase [Paenibacillus stellifer]|uniref:Chromosome segregation ATPase n=1 Tax=Paenibacillus stellifer TaxID=169760 RepID=A0A089LLN4_9BACL|nr:chromosome segregation ATPase [Paenibacillus stellifer]AIQ62421.1 chromosome segregation ATPase [Paenibacillus stellifer]